MAGGGLSQCGEGEGLPEVGVQQAGGGPLFGVVKMRILVFGLWELDTAGYSCGPVKWPSLQLRELRAAEGSWGKKH